MAKSWTTVLLISAFGGLLLVGSAVPTDAQTYQGGIRGAVRDPGGVVPGAEVSIVNEATNATRTMVSNETGEYSFSNVLPGVYTLRVKMTGFKTYEQKAIPIGTQQFLVIDVTLQIGNVAEEVTVTGQSPLTETANASVGSSLDKKTLETLPTVGRNAFFLTITTPNVVPTGDPIFVRQQDQTNSSLLSLGGGPRRGNNYTLEGVPITDMRNRAVIIPSIESVEEVRVQVSTYDAEMGRTGGGVFNTVGKSGSNQFHGSALYENRPEWGQGMLFFPKKAGLPKPDTYFHQYGGSFGGPIRRDHTFFWASTEGYKTQTVRTNVLVLPTALERTGDFSQSAVTIYNPFTNPRAPFEGNRIPANLINPVSKAMLADLPLPTEGRNRAATAQLIDRANQATAKIDHRWNDRWTTTGMYGWYDSEEPETRLWGNPLNATPADPGDGALFRTVHLITLNTLWVPNSNTVLAMRYGYNQFVDDCVPAPFDPATLPFAQGYIDSLPFKKFPRISVDGYAGTRDGLTGSAPGAGARLLGDREFIPITWYSQNANASMSKFIGRQTIKFGGDYRQIALKFTPERSSGDFFFDRRFTASSPTAGIGGDAFAAYLLGVPSTGLINVPTQHDMFINYYAGYVQDDWRLTSNLTLNGGVRYEFEQGLQERDNKLSVGFCRDCAFPVQVPGLTLKGGLVYAGVGDNPTHQADPQKTKFGPRGGFTYSIGPKTVVRGGYGLYWAPTQYPFPGESAYGTRGFTATTNYVATFDGYQTPCPGCSLTNPFPNGLEQPKGSADGLLTGVGSTVAFVDQFSKGAHVHHFSIDLQRELPGEMVVSLGYVGARSENLGVGGVNNVAVNINQIPVQFQSLGNALNDRVPNPFFGTPIGVGRLANSTTTRGQLLRPYPQFDSLNAIRVSDGRARYHSVVARFERRMTRTLGGRVNYTWSRLSDNQFGESNTFSNRSATPLDNYNLDAEFSRSLLDTPHRLNLAVSYELPFGHGKRWVNQGGLADVLLGGWVVTGVGSYQSGFPIQVSQSSNNSGLLGSGQRPNVVSGTDPQLTGDARGSYDSICQCVRWLNPLAWSPATAFTFGNAPRIDTSARTPTKKNTDLGIQKTQRVGGSKTVMIRFEIINLFDDPNWLGPNTAFGQSTFGQIREVGGFPRLLQILVRAGW
jgi:trimeric autotransporter adhesin